MYPQPQQPQPYYAPVIVATLAPITATNPPPTPPPVETTPKMDGYYRRLYDAEIESPEGLDGAENGKQVTARVWAKLDVESGEEQPVRKLEGIKEDVLKMLKEQLLSKYDGLMRNIRSRIDILPSSGDEKLFNETGAPGSIQGLVTVRFEAVGKEDTLISSVEKEEYDESPIDLLKNYKKACKDLHNILQSYAERNSEMIKSAEVNCDGKSFVNKTAKPKAAKELEDGL
ncbi:hypothetical protein DdX_16404 [Ditylenchus destructor]|uniref:Uncharacterized protein n=1 Tax=Ditylenchus destructor TaxID=166010 RepID=A0AAD4MNX1_9BILA|nr:hypothetical protein DdX_16404 [Ditylenchus destructor]